MTNNLDLRPEGQQDERIDRYLLRQMTREEEVRFESDLATDASLRRRARFIAQTLKTMRTVEQEAEGLMPADQGHRAAARNPLAQKPKKK